MAWFDVTLLENDRPETNAQQPINDQPHGFPQSPNFPLAPLYQHNVEPVIGAFPAGMHNLFKAGRPVVERDTVDQGFDIFLHRFPEYAACVFPFYLCRGMHQCIGQLAVGRKQE